MAFIDILIEPPSYGWQDKNGELIKPSQGELFRECLRRMNIFKSRKNFLGFFGWFEVLCLIPFFVIFFVKFFSLPMLVCAFVYGMVCMGTHGTIWYHRYSTHRAFTFKNKFWMFFTRNLVLKLVPEETYVISHHVHHCKSDMPGDPYNAHAGFLYCFLADTNHQQISQTLSREDYPRVAALLKDTGVVPNTYEQYLYWGSIAHPVRVIANWILNWVFWFGVFVLIGGLPLAFACFAGAAVWAVGIRTFNFEGHGKGKDKRTVGTDFDWDDMSINQRWPGYVAGEWHNNHHLYPNSAQSGFLPHQVDLAWVYVWLLNKIGGVSAYNNSKKDFLEKYYYPYKRKVKEEKTSEKVVEEEKVVEA